MTRWTWLLLPLAVCVCTLGSSSCIQIGPDDDDGGASSSDTPPTAGDQCTSVINAFCARAQACYGEDPDFCVPQGISSCCGNSCNSVATSTDHAVQVCVADLGAASCDSIQASTYNSTELPTRCQKVVKY